MDGKSNRVRHMENEAAGTDAHLFVELADAYRAAGELDRSLAVLRRGLEGHGGCIPAYVMMGRVLVEQSRYPEAIVTFEHVLELDPNNDEAKGALANMPRERPPANGVGRRTGKAVEPSRRDPIVDAKPSRPQRAELPAPPLAAPATEQLPATPRSESPALDQTAIALADLLVGLLEYRDPFFRGGTSLTRLLTSSIAREMKLSTEEVNAFTLGAVLRDLGSVPLKGLVSKPGSELGHEERRRVEVHVETTLELLTAVDLPPAVRETIRSHHERYDGNGYPDGLRGEQIPLGARIVALADSFGAMISARPHRLPHSVAAAIDEVKKAAGSQFDPAVVEALVRVLTATDWRGVKFGLRHHILIVDPNETRAMVLATKLLSNGYLAEAAFDMDHARERLDQSKIAGLILSAESRETEKEALTLIREMRSKARLAMLPVVVTEAEPTERVELLEAGADVCLGKNSSFKELKATVEAFLRREEKAFTTRWAEMPWAGLKGEIKDFPLQWLLQVLNYDSRSAAVFLTTDNEEGVIYVANGNPKHARTKKLMGEEAFRHMLRWQKGTFTLDPEARTGETTITTPIMNLLLEQALEDDHASFFGAVKP
jgi:response regulator RpfG family c-di-GMP phosphodiesterase